MGNRLHIMMDWEHLSHGSPEERSTFGALGVRLSDRWLTEAEDTLVGRVRQQVHVSGYHLAEWLAWNWWRLRWEPFRASSRWQMAHGMASIGGGYIWPNIEFVSDGKRMLVLARPTQPCTSEPLRYISDFGDVISISEFVASSRQFIETVVEQVSESVPESNLKTVWQETLREGSDPKLSVYRKIEAQLGFDPDEGPQELIERLLVDASQLGDEAISELASEDLEIPPKGHELRKLAETEGHEIDLRQLPVLGDAKYLTEPNGAWLLGQSAARALRSQERLGQGALNDKKLTSLAATSQKTTQPGKGASASFTYALGNGSSRSHVVIQPQTHTGRRFALARWLGDHLLSSVHEPLVPVMRRSRTFRQKLQRAFAAELLCPLEQTQLILGDDLSEENQEALAAEYEVSPMLIRTQLVNNNLLPRQSLLDF